MQEIYAYRDGKLIGVYKSSQEASKALNLSDSTISTIKNQKKKTRKGLRFSNEPLSEEILAEDRKTNTLDKHNFYDEIDERNFTFPTRGKDLVQALEKYIARNIRPTVIMRMDKQTAKLHEYYLKGLFTRIYNRVK